MEHKKLCRSMEDKAICGVCSGFARYFDIDPIIIRLVVVLLALTGTIGIWFYIIAAIVMPKDTECFAQTAYRYDPQTGRPLYSDGTNVYENYGGAGSSTAQSGETSGFYASEAASEPVDVEFKAEPYTESENEADSGNVSGEYKQAETFAGEQPKAEQAAGQDPYRNFQAYGAQQDKRPAQKKTNRSRNTGILFIIIGVVILAKIILPRINMWIPISIASIFFGIFLLCRKD